MKIQLLLSSPFTGAKLATLPTFQLVGWRCRATPIKKTSLSAMLPPENPHEQNSFPETQPAHGILHFLSVSICVHPWFKNGGVQRHAGFRRFK
jgi:hypothetical protein